MSHHNGQNESPGEAMAPDRELDRFAATLRAGLPQLPEQALRRIEHRVQADLNRAYPPAPLPMRSNGRWAAVAAMLLLTIIFAAHVSDSPRSPDPGVQIAQQGTDEFEIVIDIGDPSTQPPNGRTAWDSLFGSVERYTSLFGFESLTRR